MPDIKYRKQLEELLALGLYIDEADLVINGVLTLEEVLKLHVEKPLDGNLKVEEVQMETYEDAEEIMKVVKKITKEKSEK